MLLVNIKEIVGIEEKGLLMKRGAEMSKTGRIKNAFLLTKGKKIVDYGKMGSPECKKYLEENHRVYDLSGSMVMPAFCDSHTHLVYANSREKEFVDKIRGLSYEEIAKRGGGILNSAKATAKASENELYDMACKRLDEVMRMGTGAIEIKSGYGLTTESELKLLRVIRRLKETSPMTIKSNFLGARCF